MRSAKQWIRALDLQKHVEGGYYRETYRSTDLLSAEGLPDRFAGARAASTAIYFLLEEGDFSAFHRIESDEVWHFYAGGNLLLHVLRADGQLSQITLSNCGAGSLQATVRAGDWFAAEVQPGGTFALTGCTVAPGFAFEDLEIPDRGSLLERYPRHTQLITRLTRMRRH